MSRVKRGVVAHRRHKKILKAAKGYYGARSRIFRVAKQAVTKAGQYAYRDRRVKKRTFRALWITRINAQSRAEGISYSRLFTIKRHLLLSQNRRRLPWLDIFVPGFSRHQIMQIERGKGRSSFPFLFLI